MFSRIRLLAFVWLLSCVNPVNAETFQLEDIRVEGLQRIMVGTVFNYLPIKPGDYLSDEKTPELIRALYKTGFFKDVRLERDGNVLVVVVNERPAVAEIHFSGNQSIDDDALRNALKMAGLAEGRTFSQPVLDDIQREMEQQFFNQGKYGVKVSSIVTPLARNRVAIDIDIIEGDTTRIKKINIVGNHAFNDATLLDAFQLSTGGWFSGISRNDQYSRQKLAGDLETLRTYYLDRGYINFDIESTQVTITPDKKSIYITINVTEGDIYTLHDIQLAGDYVGEVNDYFNAIHLRRGETFNRRSVVDSSERINRLLSDSGYAFANVNAIPEINEEEKTVAVTFFVDPGKRTYVRRINIRGNSRTRDEVIRREFRQMEAAWFSSEKLKLSRERVQRTGYFEEIHIETPRVPDTNDQLDINVDVTEKPSGALLAGLGFSQSDGFIINASISQDNFFGTGKKVTLALKTSSANRHYEVSYVNPYYTVDGVSRGFQLSYRSTDFDELDTADYKTDNAIFGVNFGVPLSEFNRINLGTRVVHTNFKMGSDPSTEVFNWVANEGQNYLNFEANLGWRHDSRDSAIFPQRGSLQRLIGEVSVPGSDLTYFKASYKHRRYWSLAKHWVISLNGEAGYGNAYSETHKLPFFENFYLGGPQSVRGYQTFSIGPRDSENDPIGGNVKILANAELFLPPINDSPMRLLAFVDAGTILDGNQFDSDEMRYSTGVGLAWLSPVGALTLSLATPFNADEQDEKETFQFTFGTTF